MKFWRSSNLGGLELLQASYGAYAFPRHIHDEYVLGVIVQGVEAVQHKGTTHVAPAGSLIMINPGEWHSNYSINEAGFGYRMLYPCHDLMKHVMSQIYGREQAAPYLHHPVASDEILRQLLLRLHVSFENGGSALEQESYFLAAMARLLACHSTEPAVLPPVPPIRLYVRQVRDYLDANYSENVSLESLSTLVNISPFHLLRAFRDEVGLSPSQYQTCRRIAHAKELLRSGLSIAQVAAETGFVDQSHLTRHFKQICGVTPGQYTPGRKNLQDLVPN